MWKIVGRPRSRALCFGLVVLSAGCGTTPQVATLAQPPKPATTAPPSGDSAEASELLSVPQVLALLQSDPLAPVTVVRIVDAELDPATPIAAPELEAPTFIEAAAVSRQGSRVRIAFDTPNARVMMWVPQQAVALYIASAFEVPQVPSAGTEPAGRVTLRAGALVEKMNVDGAKVEVRHLGGLQVTAVVPTAQLTATVPERRIGMQIGGNRILVTPGALIRQQPNWSAPVLATVNSAYQLMLVRHVDDKWDEVAYSDFSLDVRGYYSKQLPPGRTAGNWQRRSQLSLANSGDTTVAAGTCLYASVGGGIAGVVKSDFTTDVRPSDRNGWSAAAIATPWGPVTFALRTSAPKTGRTWAACDEP